MPARVHREHPVRASALPTAVLLPARRVVSIHPTLRAVRRNRRSREWHERDRHQHCSNLPPAVRSGVWDRHIVQHRTNLPTPVRGGVRDRRIRQHRSDLPTAAVHLRSRGDQRQYGKRYGDSFVRPTVPTSLRSG